MQLPLHEPRPGVVWRSEPVHHILRVGHEARTDPTVGGDDPSAGYSDRDDYLDGLWLQGSSQWDGLTHIRHPEHGNYNASPDADIHGGPGTRLAVDRRAERGVVGRGVLVDIAGHLATLGDPIDVTASRQITAAQLDAALAAQGTTLEDGDLLLLHTAWLHHLMALQEKDRAPLLDKRQGRRRSKVVPGAWRRLARIDDPSGRIAIDYRATGVA